MLEVVFEQVDSMLEDSVEAESMLVEDYSKQEDFVEGYYSAQEVGSMVMDSKVESIVMELEVIKVKEQVQFDSTMAMAS